MKWAQRIHGTVFENRWRSCVVDDVKSESTMCPTEKFKEYREEQEKLNGGLHVSMI